MTWSWTEWSLGSSPRRTSRLTWQVSTHWECSRTVHLPSLSTGREKGLLWTRSSMLSSSSLIEWSKRVDPGTMRRRWTSLRVMELIELLRLSRQTQLEDRRLTSSERSNRVIKRSRLKGKRILRRVQETLLSSLEEHLWKSWETRPWWSLSWPLLTSQTWWWAQKFLPYKSKSFLRSPSHTLERVSTPLQLLLLLRTSSWQMRQT